MKTIAGFSVVLVLLLLSACLHPVPFIRNRLGPPQVGLPVGSDPFRDRRSVAAEPAEAHQAHDCSAAMYVGPRECFVRGEKAADRGVDEYAAVEFEYWLECGDEASLCGVLVRCVCKGPKGE